MGIHGRGGLKGKVIEVNVVNKFCICIKMEE
jgi:hypothetical protein